MESYRLSAMFMNHVRNEANRLGVSVGDLLETAKKEYEKYAKNIPIFVINRKTGKFIFRADITQRFDRSNAIFSVLGEDLHFNVEQSGGKTVLLTGREDGEDVVYQVFYHLNGMPDKVERNGKIAYGMIV